jgi:hypothetical protein
MKILKRSIDSFPYGPEMRGRTAIVVSMPTPMLATYVPFSATLEGKVYPERMRVLASSTSAIELRRSDDRTLILKPELGFYPSPRRYSPDGLGQPAPLVHGAYMFQALDNLVRDNAHPYSVGDKIEITDLTIEILKMNDEGKPAEVSFQFARPLEDSSFVWLGWKNWEYVPFKLPAVGETITLPTEMGAAL